MYENFSSLGVFGEGSTKLKKIRRINKLIKEYGVDLMAGCETWTNFIGVLTPVAGVSLFCVGLKVLIPTRCLAPNQASRTLFQSICYERSTIALGSFPSSPHARRPSLLTSLFSCGVYFYIAFFCVSVLPLLPLYVQQSAPQGVLAMSVNENSHQRTKQTRSLAPSVSLLILEGSSAPLDGVAAAVAAPRKCVGCLADIANSSYAQIIGGRGASSHGCIHTVCMQCFGLAHALRSADIKLKCPGILCAYQSRRWIVHSPVASRTGSTRSWQQIEQCIVLPMDYKRHPNLFFQHQPDQYRDVHSILSLVTKNRANPRASNYYAVELRNDSTNPGAVQWWTVWLAGDWDGASSLSCST